MSDVNYKIDNVKITTENTDVVTNVATSSGPEYWLVDQRYPANTNAPEMGADSWETREINHQQNIVSWGSINTTTHRITLQPGKYILEASAPAYACLRHRIRLHETTSDLTMAGGSSMFCKNGNIEGYNRSTLETVLDIPVAQTYEIQHRLQISVFAPFGIASGTAFAGQEIYTQIKVTRIGEAS